MLNVVFQSIELINVSDILCLCSHIIYIYANKRGHITSIEMHLSILIKYIVPARLAAGAGADWD